jgi:hypothetical protein
MSLLWKHPQFPQFQFNPFRLSFNYATSNSKLFHQRTLNILMTLNCGVWKFAAAMAQLSGEDAVFDVNRGQTVESFDIDGS